MTSLLTSFFVIFLKISIELLIIDLQTTTIPPFAMFFNESIWYLGLIHVKIVDLSFLTSYGVIIDVIFCHFFKISIKLQIIDLQTTHDTSFYKVFWYKHLISGVIFQNSQFIISDVIWRHYWHYLLSFFLKYL